jgi:hypothetical protein
MTKIAELRAERSALMADISLWLPYPEVEEPLVEPEEPLVELYSMEI